MLKQKQHWYFIAPTKLEACVEARLVEISKPFRIPPDVNRRGFTASVEEAKGLKYFSTLEQARSELCDVHLCRLRLACNALHGWVKERRRCWLPHFYQPTECDLKTVLKSYSTQTQSITSWTRLDLAASLALFTLPCKHINIHSHAITCTV